MYFPTITYLLVTALAAALPAHAKTFVTRDFYLKNIAFPQLARISEFRANLTSAGTLTPAQADALNLVQDVVANFATDKLDAAERACVAAFSREVCYGIITANNLRGGGSGGGGGAVGARAAAADNWCACATLSDYCKHGMYFVPVSFFQRDESMYLISLLFCGRLLQVEKEQLLVSKL